MSTGADSVLVAIFGYGGEATAEALQTVAEAQRRGARALFVDTAQEFDAGAASLAGIDLSELLVMHPDDADRSMRAIRILAESGAVGFVAIDRASEFFSAEGDEKASRDAGIPFIWAEYGFGKAISPDAAIKSIKDLSYSVSRLI